ncbi:MAG: hypothetical protein WCK70_04645 [Chloroflexales bacterium]|jgi:gas vesicle protein
MSDTDHLIAELFPHERRGRMVNGMLFGVLAGAAMAALLTSQSGAATRAVLRERGLELKDRVDELLRRRLPAA